MSLAPTQDHNARSSVTVAVGKTKATLNLPAWQASELPHAKRTLVTWQPQTAVSASNFGGAYVEFVIFPNDLDTIQELWLQVGLGAASQTGGSSLYFSSDLSFMIKQIDLVSNGSSETLFSLQGAGLVLATPAVAHSGFPTQTPPRLILAPLLQGSPLALFKIPNSP